jgi:hypothetical protein
MGLFACFQLFLMKSPTNSKCYKVLKTVNKDMKTYCNAAPVFVMFLTSHPVNTTLFIGGCRSISSEHHHESGCTPPYVLPDQPVPLLSRKCTSLMHPSMCFFPRTDSFEAVLYR